MLNWFKPKKQSVVGVDLSAKSIKLLQLVKVEDSWQVVAYGFANLLPDAMDGTTVKNPELITQAIKSVLSNTTFSAKDAIVSVPDSTVITKIIQLNQNLSESEMEELVVLEADKHISYPIDEVSVDFSVLGPSAKGGDLVDVLMVASRSINVTDRTSAINHAGLNTMVVDVESYVIERAMQLVQAQLPNNGIKKTVALFDIGAMYSHLFVLDDMKMVYSREDEFGGQLLVQSLATHTEKTLEEAAGLIRSGHLPNDYETAVLMPFLDSVVMQLKRTLQFFYSAANYNSLDCIVLAGGVSKIPNLDSIIKAQLNIDVVIANPFLTMKFDKNVSASLLQAEGSTLLLACGLAMREVV